MKQATKEKLMSFWFEIKTMLTILLTIGFIILMGDLFGKWGFIGSILAIIIVIVVRGWKIRWLYMMQLREMEQVIWGKTLDKKNWKKGEINKIKVKPEWRKDKDDKETKQG